jgi:hypothetical protein
MSVGYAFCSIHAIYAVRYMYYEYAIKGMRLTLSTDGGPTAPTDLPDYGARRVDPGIGNAEVETFEFQGGLFARASRTESIFQLLYCGKTAGLEISASTLRPVSRQSPATLA